MGRVEKRTYLCEGVAVATLLVPSPLDLGQEWANLAPLYKRLARANDALLHSLFGESDISICSVT